MSKRLLAFIGILSLLLFACSQKPTGPNIKEGKWEITVTMESKGQMPFQLPPQTFTQCITKEKAIPQEAQAGTGCQIVKNEIKGDTVSWVIECKSPEGTIISDGTVTYKGDNFDGTVKIKHPNMEIVQKMTGKWIGECK